MKAGYILHFYTQVYIMPYIIFVHHAAAVFASYHGKSTSEGRVEDPTPMFSSDAFSDVPPKY
jgi:hypothetical protein